MCKVCLISSSCFIHLCLLSIDMRDMRMRRYCIFCFIGRNRWIEYNPKVGIDYDASYVSADWYGWLHYKTDTPPTIVSFLFIDHLLCHIVLHCVRERPYFYCLLILIFDLFFKFQKPPPQYKWIKDHEPNMSGTPGQYVPYTTTLPKIQSWVPPKKTGKS